jgi:trigger factor
MKVQVEEGALWRRTLQIEIPPERVTTEMEGVVKEFRNRMAVPGFRKGKAPLELVEARLGNGLDVEFLQRVVPRVYEEALEQAKLYPISEPTFENIKFKRGEPLSFRASFDVRPVIEVKGYKGLEIEKVEFEVGDKDVEWAMEELRKSNPEYVSVDRESREGDLLVIDYEKLGEAGDPEKGSNVKGYPLVLGSHVVLDEIEQSLFGTVKGQEKKVRVTFPSEHRDEKVAGSKATFRVEVKEVKERKEASLDDEFAKRLGTNGGLEELKSRVRLELEGKAVLRSQELLESTLYDEITSLNSFDLPESMVGRMLGNIVGRQKEKLSPEDDAKFQEEFRPSVARFIKRHLIIQQVAKQENIEVSEKDVEEEMSRIASFQNVSLDEVKDRFKNEAELDRLRDSILERNVTELLISQATPKVVKRPLGKPEGE